MTEKKPTVIDMAALAQDVEDTRLAMEIADKARRDATRASNDATARYKTAANKYREAVNVFVPPDVHFGVK